MPKIRNSEDEPILEIVNNHQQLSKLLFTFVPDRQVGQLIIVAPNSLTILKTNIKTTNTEFSFIEVWFTDQNHRPLEIKDKVIITLIIWTG